MEGGDDARVGEEIMEETDVLFLPCVYADFWGLMLYTQIYEFNNRLLRHGAYLMSDRVPLAVMRLAIAEKGIFDTCILFTESTLLELEVPRYIDACFDDAFLGFDIR